jgi:hypothetical protein
LNLSHHSNEHRIPYVLRARNTTPLCHLVTQTKLNLNNIKNILLFISFLI